MVAPLRCRRARTCLNRCMLLRRDEVFTRSVADLRRRRAARRLCG